MSNPTVVTNTYPPKNPNESQYRDTLNRLVSEHLAWRTKEGISKAYVANAALEMINDILGYDVWDLWLEYEHVSQAMRVLSYMNRFNNESGRYALDVDTRSNELILSNVINHPWFSRLHPFTWNDMDDEIRIDETYTGTLSLMDSGYVYSQPIIAYKEGDVVDFVNALEWLFTTHVRGRVIF